MLIARGVTNQLAERFGLGFADRSNGLRKHLLTSTNVTEASALSAGLLGAALSE